MTFVVLNIVRFGIRTDRICKRYRDPDDPLSRFNYQRNVLNNLERLSTAEKGDVFFHIFWSIAFVLTLLLFALGSTS